jgi:hypothetical protein
LICTGAGVETGVDTGCICGECDTGACNAPEKSSCCCTEKSKTGNTDMVGSLVGLVTTFPRISGWQQQDIGMIADTGIGIKGSKRKNIFIKNGVPGDVDATLRNV